MLRLFQSSGPLTLLLYFICSAGLQLHFFIHPQEFKTSYESLAAHTIFIDWFRFDKIPVFILSLIHIIIVSVTGILINFLLQSSKLIQKPGLLPAIVFVICLSIFPEFSLLSPPLFCVTIITILLFRIIGTYNQSKVDNVLFDAGVISACISLIYYPAIIFSIFSILAIFRLRSTSLREFVIMISGITVVYFLMFTLVFWLQIMPEFTSQFYLPRSLPDIKSLFTTINIIRFIIIGTALLVSFWYLNDKFSSNLVQVRKYFGTMINLMIFSVLLFFFTQEPNLDELVFLLLPVTIFLSYYFAQSKTTTAELIFICMITTAIIFQYLNFTS